MRTRLERLLAIEKEIRSGRYPSVEDLCRTYAVKSRTVYQDIRILRERLGLEIEFDRSRNGYFNSSPGTTLPSFDLSREEYLLLVLGCEILSASLGTDFKPILDRVLEKIRERLPPGTAIDNAVAKEMIQSAVAENASVSPVVLFDVARACLDKVAIELTCKIPEGDSIAFVFEPSQLIESNKSWHLSGCVRGTAIAKQICLTDIIDYRLVGTADADS